MLGIKNLSIAGRGGSSTWWDKMWSSYTKLNPGVYSESVATEFKRRMKPDYVDSAGTGYYYNTFGPSGLNKTTADWIYLLTTSGNVTNRTITKSGAILKWNLDGTIVTQNALPAYVKGVNAGIITFTSTDGWLGVTALAINTNQFAGVQPNFNTPNVTSFNTSSNLLTGRAGSLYATNKMSSANISGNLWTTAMVDAELAYYNTMFAATPPIKNLTLNLSGATMGIPTGAGSNPDYLGIIAKVQAAGFIPTISTRTS